MAKTANPALVIGLGGTGQWVLTYLKKNLVDTYGEVPKTVRLLSFDTTGIASEAEIEKGQAEERAQVGNVTLTAGEFVYLGGNIKQICQDIKNDERKYPHIRTWLQAQYYLSAHDDDAYDISKGAGRRRQFGRMAIFYDLATGSPQVIGKIEQALSDIKTARERTMPVEIYVVCSLAGGTGAGMVIDVAHLARMMAQKVQLDCAVRGFVVLQNTFAPVARIDDVQPSAFATMRELDRFMLVFDRDYPMYYSSSAQKSDLQTIYRSKLFDNCYLLDARRTTKPLDGVPPKLGVFPSVADCMSVLLDPETGETFATHYKNVNDRLAKAQVQHSKTLYSSLGTYTYILPVEDIIERNTLKLARELLEKRLVTIDYDEATKTLALNSGKVVEFKGSAREEAKDFLRMERSASNVPNVIFCQNVARQLDMALDQQHVIDDFSALGLELLAWLKPLEDDDSMIQAGNRIDTVLQTSLIAEIPDAKTTGEDFQTAADRIDRDIRDLRRKLLGSEEQGGRKTSGELQNGLIDYQKRNLTRFRRLLSEKLLLLLNGVTDDPVAAKTGKLPFTREFLEWLIKGLEEFEVFLETVNKTRAKGGLLAQAREFTLQTRQRMFDTVHEVGILARLRRTAVEAENIHIENEDYAFSLEREEVLYQEVLQMTRQLKEIVQEAKEQVDQWLNCLMLGGAPESGEKGVFRVLLDKQTELVRRRQNQARTEVHGYLTNDSYEDALFESRVDASRLGQIMRQLDWRLIGDEKFDLRLFYSAPRKRMGDEEEPEFQKKAPKWNVTATEANVQLFLEHLRLTFLDIRNETIADRLSDSLTAARASKDLLDNSGALVSYADNEQPLAEKHNYVCVNQGNQVNYFTSLESELKKSAPNDKDNQVTGQSNRHRCTILSTVDLIINEQTRPYAAAAAAYRQHNGDRKLLHNFPAEVNATGFEQRLLQPPIREAYRLLSPELVAMLEDREMVNRFVMSLVYGLIKEEEAVQEEGSDFRSRKNQYVLRLDTSSRRQRQVESWMVRLTQPSAEPRLLDAMKNFVFVHLDPQNGTRAIKDISPDVNVLIPPENVDRAITRREESYVSGREKVVEAFLTLLKDPKVSNLLKPEGDLKLVSAFRSFLTDHERPLRRAEMTIVHQELAHMLDNNLDCYDIEYDIELKRLFTEFISQYEGGQQISAGNYNLLINLLERFIEDDVLLWRGKRLPNLSRGEKGSEDQLAKDLGAIIHLVLWDEIQRLERLRNQQIS